MIIHGYTYPESLRCYGDLCIQPQLLWFQEASWYVYFTQPHVPSFLFLESRWEKANQAATQRQTELETCADRLGNFASAANQLGPWLREKELMMSVLGPLSIDPKMLNTQKQQVQVHTRVHFWVRMFPLYPVHAALSKQYKTSGISRSG